MKILDTQVAAFVTQTLLDIKKGCFDAYKNGDVLLRLPGKVDFQMEIVKTAFNGIVRTQTTTPLADEVSTQVSAAFSETTTRTPATTQQDDSAQNGSDISTDTTTYDEYIYTS